MNELRQKPAAVAGGRRRSCWRALITELYVLTDLQAETTATGSKRRLLLTGRAKKRQRHAM